ncbi:hypothetical protein [uncultured Robinsoniella sp.]
MAWSILANRPHRAGMELALHVLEIIHGIGESAGSGNNGFWGATEESALV